MGEFEDITIETKTKYTEKEDKKKKKKEKQEKKNMSLSEVRDNITWSNMYLVSPNHAEYRKKTDEIMDEKFYKFDEIPIKIPMVFFTEIENNQP